MLILNSIRNYGAYIIIALVVVQLLYFVYQQRKKDKWVRGKVYALLQFDSKRGLKEWYDNSEEWTGVEGITIKEG